MVAKNLEDRYQSMSEVIVALESMETWQQATVTIEQPSSTSPENSDTLIQNLLVMPTIRQTKVRIPAPATKAKISQPPWKNVKALFGAGLLGLLLLAGIIVSLQTEEGTLIVEVDQPDAMVQVLDAEGKVEVSQKGDGGKITISVDPGKHRLKVVKDGFTTYGQEFEMEKSGKKTIAAKLVPLEEEPAMVGPKPAPVDAEKKRLFFETPTFVPWAKEVVAMPAELQVEAVSQKLVDLNSGFDGKVTHQIANGVVTELRFITDQVTDISPVRALAGLSGLHCVGSDYPKRNGKPADLSPLKGMQLSVLHFGGTQISDLSPLKDMPLLSGLNAYGTPIYDLSPLSGIPLTTLDVGLTSVTDLSPLIGMPLEQLWIASTQVTDLLPLTKMPLKQVSLVETYVSDLSPLKDLPLERLGLDFTPHWNTEQIRSIKTLETIYTSQPNSDKPAVEFCDSLEALQASLNEPLAFESPGFDEWVKQTAALPVDQQVEAVSRKLQELNPRFDGMVTPVVEGDVVTGLTFSTDGVTDISPVRGLEGLKTLTCSGRKQGGVGSLAPLKGMPLTELTINYSHVADLSPLAGMKLTRLDMYVGDIADRSPLKDMPLTQLHLMSNPVANLSPLKGMLLTDISVSATLVTDLSPLRDMPLTVLSFYRTNVDDLSPLRDLPLTYLVCGRTTVTDFSPLRNVPLKYLRFDFSPERDTQLLRSITTLQTINDMPTSEFRKEVEERQKGK